MGDFKVEIDGQSYLTIVDGRRVYTRGKTWNFMAGRGLSVARINEVVEERYKWSTGQRMIIWYGFEVRFGVTIESKQQHNEPAHVMTEEMDDHAPFFAWPKQAYEGGYEDDEPVGCNEENTYLRFATSLVHLVAPMVVRTMIFVRSVVV